MGKPHKQYIPAASLLCILYNFNNTCLLKLIYKTNRCILLFLPYLRQHSHIHLIYPVTEQVDVLPVMTDDED